MSFTVRDALVRNLEELGERNFKRFRTKLNEFPVEEPYRSIPKARLEKADEDDVADLILAAYSNPYGVTVTLEVLRQIDQNQIAEKLEQDLEKASNYKKPSNGDKPAVNNYGILEMAPNRAVNNYGILEIVPNPAGTTGRHY
ncbi:apoptosis-associated speck-like protein containing a CARD isoform X5 [Pelobates fuscus]|uniref:apoptosis-associated speck-like protein containing a CARD isoform X5 n=1 Tax=Pelobates fuscus TaxID=191477 RepID=UPI002FE4DE45